MNRLLVALASLMLNLGARHLPSGLSPRLQSLTASKGMRVMVVCAMFYLSTRDVMLSIALAFISFVIVSTLLNENSTYAMIDGLRIVNAVQPMHAVPLVTKQAYDASVDLIMRFRKQARRMPETEIP